MPRQDPPSRLFSAGNATPESAAARADVESQRRADPREIDQQARDILESITDAFFALGRDWKFRYANPQSGRILGRDPAGLIGLSIWDEYPGLIGSPFEPIYRSAMNGTPASMTEFYPDHDRWYEVRTYPSSNGISIYFRDVSAQRKAEEALRASETQRRLALESAELGSWHIDLVTRELRTDERFRAIFGVAGDAMTYGHALGMVHADDRQRVSDAVGAATREQDPSPYSVEYRVVRADGSVRWVFAKGRTNVLVVGGQQTIVSFDGTLADVTDRKLAEVERQELLDSERAARSVAENASRMKDEFLATLSHELRTPLSAIIGWAQILTTPAARPADILRGAEVIQRNARAQSQIIEDLLDMSRIIGGKVRLDVEPLELSSIVQHAVDTARPTAEAKSIRLVAGIDPLEGSPVSGDPARLQQVMWNLLSNAIKFTPAGGLVNVVVERADTRLEIHVADSGEGIAPEFLPFVFDRFRQADGSTTRWHGGLGLGLAIVKQLVELHGGSIRVTSEGAGKGSTFVVTLPLVVAAERAVASPALSAHSSTPARPATAVDACVELEGVHVLVVDDQVDVRELLTRVLEDRHAIVTTAGSAAEAFRKFEDQRFHILISDIGMPGEDGYNLIRRIRLLDEDRGGQVPAIALTAYARAEDRAKAIAAGYTLHVAKPVEPSELLTLVAAAV
jgi:PAS domain S-box-containing protein